MNIESKKSRTTRITGVDALPTEWSKPPSGDRSPDLASARRARLPTRVQRLASLGAAAELRADRASRDRFGSGAPDTDALAGALELSAGWSAVAADAKQWLRYARAQEKAAWAQALPQINALRPCFEAAAQLEPDVLRRYACLHRFYGARSAAARAGAAKRGRSIAPVGDLVPPAQTAAPAARRLVAGPSDEVEFAIGR